jgi:hypothetical protein
VLVVYWFLSAGCCWFCEKVRCVSLADLLPKVREQALRTIARSL